MEHAPYRRKVVRIYAYTLAIGGAYYALISLTGIKIPCIYATLFHLQCPGCGATRMALALLRLDFRAAFGYNPALFILFFLWNAVALLYFWGRPRFVRREFFLQCAMAVSIAVLVAWGFFRNFA